MYGQSGKYPSREVANSNAELKASKAAVASKFLGLQPGGSAPYSAARVDYAKTGFAEDNEDSMIWPVKFTMTTAFRGDYKWGQFFGEQWRAKKFDNAPGANLDDQFYRVNPRTNEYLQISANADFLPYLIRLPVTSDVRFRH